LLRHGIVYFGGTAWTAEHERWLRGQRFGQPGLQTAFDEAFDTMLAALARRDRLDAAITTMAATSPWEPVVIRLACVRGIATLTAFGLATEIGDWQRFTGASIGAYLGMVPAEYSSGSHRAQGSITKAGNSHARRLLVEAAWHHRRPLRAPTKATRAHRDMVSPAVSARAQAADRRLHRRWNTLDARGKRPAVSVVAVARELAGWCWSLAIMD
jgi:transposase